MPATPASRASVLSGGAPGVLAGLPGSKNVITPDEAVVIVVRKLGSSLSKKMNGFRIQIKSEGEKMSLAGWIYPDDRDMMPGWKK